MASMVQKIAQITLNNQNVSYASSTSIPPRQIMMCDLCGGEHNLGECLNDDMGSQSTMEQVDLVGYGRQQQSFKPQGAYNPNASRNHPGFSWSNPMGAANPQSFGNRGPPPGFQGQQNYRDTIDSCVRETLEESNWISNDPLGVDVDDTIEEEQIDEDTSGFDELFDENELLVQPSSPKLEVFGLGDQLANHNGDNHPKILKARMHLTPLLKIMHTSYKMPPKGRNSRRGRREESSQQAQQLPQEPQFQIFNTPQARERYNTWISTRGIKKERGILLNVPAHWNWGPTFLAQPGEAFSGLVREFYANAGDGMQTNTAIVRGVEVSFSTVDINAYYGTEDHGAIDYYHQDLRLSRLTGDMLNEIARSFHPEATWNIAHGLPAHIDYHYFGQRDRALLDFIKAKLSPYSHKGHVRRDQVLMAYCIKEQHPMNVGAIINQSIRDIASSDRKSRCFLSHPFLITELCRLAGVPINEDQEIKLTPLTFISPHYVQTHYGQGQIPANDSEDEEAGQQAENADMGDPNPMPAQPQIPQQFNMQQFITRQEEFMRRSDEINWYVGTSTYQQNQAALGFTPHFPPPPPWLQDPQYIPDYYRPHFPLPPDDADQQ
nr:uncharacterized protein LOC109169324 [Ipomoea batatas]